MEESCDLYMHFVILIFFLLSSRRLCSFITLCCLSNRDGADEEAFFLVLQCQINAQQPRMCVAPNLGSYNC